MTPTKKQPLFIVAGASGVRKSSACEILFQRETDYIVLESDILWNDVYNGDLDDGYCAYREVWMTMCANISQIGKSCVLCGCGEPRHFEVCDARKYFSDVHYLAVVCRNDILAHRMRDLRGITDENWISSSQVYNQWCWDEGAKTTPPMTLLDNSDIALSETAVQIEKWIMERLMTK